MRSPFSLPPKHTLITFFLSPFSLFIFHVSGLITFPALAQPISPEVSTRTDPAEPILQIQGVLEVGDTVLSEDGSLYDEYTFEGQAGQTVIITLESVEFDTYLLLRDFKGQGIEQNDDYDESTLNSAIVTTLPETGTYTVLVNGYDAQSRGTYRLTVVSAASEASQPQFSETALQQAEANRLNQKGLQQLNTSQFQAALQSFGQALTIYREIGDRAGEGAALNNIGEVYSSLGQYLQALDSYEQALAISRAIGDRTGEGRTLTGIGAVYDRLGQYLQALDSYEQALAISRAIGDRTGEGAALTGTGFVYRSLGQYLQALNYFGQALVISRAIGDRASEGRTLTGIGEVYRSLGQYSQALDSYEQALAISRAIGDSTGEGGTLNNIGLVYSSLGQYSQALDSYEQALAISRAIGDRASEGRTLTGIGEVYRSLGQYSQALDSYEQALAISRAIGDRTGEGGTLNNIGLVYSSLGQYSQALDSYEQALAISRAIGDRASEGRTLNNTGAIYNKLEWYLQALGYFEQALAISRAISDRTGEGGTLNNIGFTYNHLEQFSNATNYVLDSIEIFESLRTADLSDTNRISFFDTYQTVYLGLQNFLVAQGETNQALEYAERGRARAFVDLLVSRVTSNGDINAPLLGATDTLNLADIQRVAREQNATLVQYSVIFDEFLYIWVIQPTGEITFQQVDLATLDRSIRELVTTSRAAIGVRGRGTGTVVPVLSPEAQHEQEAQQRQNLQRLYQLLIEPIAQHLPTDPEQRVIFIPHQDLFLVPFAALTNAEGQYLIENHTILTAPSVQVLDLTRRQQLTNSDFSAQNENLLIIGNPIMPEVWNPQTNQMEQLSSLVGAENEAVAIAETFETEALLWDDAAKATVVEQMPNAQIIHFATHGLLEYGNPQESGVLDVPGAIALAPSANDSGLLTAAEILQMNLTAELVVLSACDTGRGRVTGDGVVGLSRAFVTAGVPSIVVSLWAVDDAATAELMVEFYDQWRQTGDKAQALRQAMLTTMQNHPDPRLWAAFTLIGEAE
jgi:CHAT domain-containing protein/tetratricopeptide (TPR) repeat protein